MPVLNEKNETKSHKKRRRWSLIGILSKKNKLKKSQESVDFCPYDGKINQKVAHNNHLKSSTDCLIEQYTCSPRLIRRCNSLQYTNHMSTYASIKSQSASNEWNTSQQSVYSSSSSACYSDIGVYRSCGSNNQSSRYIREENEKTPSVLKNVPLRSSSDIGYYQYKTNYSKKHPKLYANQTKLIGKKIPPPPPPRDPNITTVYYFRNNRLMSRESDSTYFTQESNDNIPDKVAAHVDSSRCRNENYTKEPPRSRRPIQICDVETLSSESENSIPKMQTVEEALQELEDMYNSLGLSDEDLLDRAERRDLPTVHQNMRYQSSDELDCITVKRVLPKTRRSGVPDIISDDMAYRRLNKKESKRQSFIPGSFLLVLPTVYNLDEIPKPSSGEPDITLDDVVFRSQRQHLNFLKISDPQPPFGIPLGPIVSAAPTDYLHAVPEGRYKPSFHPRKIPDTVEDDLAFRSLRKDHKLKTCIDFSFVHRNRFRIDDLTPKLDNNRIKNDTHWIINKRPSGYGCNKKNQTKLLYDSIIADDQQNLMVVKINHHKPIMLTGFTFSEASQLSKSLFRTNLLQHEPHKSHLTNDTCIAKDAPPLKLKFFRPSSSSSNERNVNGASSPVALKCSSKSYRATNYAAKKTPVASPRLTNLGLTYESVDGKNQPNFRELIKREYSHRYLRSADDRSNDGFTAMRDQNDKRLLRSPEYSEDDKTRARALVKRPANVLSSAAVTEPKTDYLHDRVDGPTRVAAFGSAVTSSADASENRRTGSPDDKPPGKDDLSLSSSSPLSAASAVPSTEYPNRMPGYLEVCLYITIYMYQLFSVNAYGTFIALIFLITLHLCRRFS